MHGVQIVFVSFIGLAASKSSYYVDLSHTQDETALGWPIFEKFQLNNAIAKYILDEPKQW